MTGAEIVACVRITGVWRWLGGPKLNGSRGVAWWRGGDGFNVSLNDAKGAWKDHVLGNGGGVLDLIQTVLGCDRRTALRWLAQRQHVELDRPPTTAQARKLALHQQHAEALARALTEWRARLLERLTRTRNAYYDADRTISIWALRNLDNPLLAGDTDPWDGIFTETSAWARHAAEREFLMEAIETMPPGELRAVKRQLGPINPDAIEDPVSRYLRDLERQLESEATKQQAA